MFLLWHRQLPRCGDQTPASVPPPAKGRSNATNTPVFSPSSFVLLSFCVVLYILFCWSGTPVGSQLVFCMHFCVWRCIPDVSMEGDVLLVHLLLCHLVLHSNYHFLKCNGYSTDMMMMTIVSLRFFIHMARGRCLWLFWSWPDQVQRMSWCSLPL